MAELSELQYRFVDEYLVDGNATRAAIRAGYAQSGAGVQGYRLLKNANVVSLLRVRQVERSKKYEVSAERTRQELGYLGYSNVKNIVDDHGRIDWSRISREDAAAIKEITTETVQLKDGIIALRTKVKMADKHQPLKTLAQIDGLMAIEGPPPQSVVFIVERSGDRQRVIEHDDHGE